MDNKVLNAIKNDYRLSDEYLDGYMSTLEQGTELAKAHAEIVAKINDQDLNEKCDAIFASTHSSSNPIYNDDFERKMARKAKAYNRAKENVKSRKLVDEQLSEDELDALSF